MSCLAGSDVSCLARQYITCLARQGLSCLARQDMSCMAREGMSCMAREGMSCFAPSPLGSETHQNCHPPSDPSTRPAHPSSNLYNSRLGTYSYRLPLGPNIYNCLPQGQAQIFTTAYRLAEPTNAAVLWQLALQNKPKSNLVLESTKFDFLNPTTPLSFGNWHAKTSRNRIWCRRAPNSISGNLRRRCPVATGTVLWQLAQL